MCHQQSGFKGDHLRDVINFAESRGKLLGKCIKDGFHMEGE